MSGWETVMRPTTGMQLEVIVRTIIIVSIIMGAVGMWYSFGAPEAKADIAARLRGYSLACWAFAAVVYLGKRAWDSFIG